jgi:hypothetical protein
MCHNPDPNNLFSNPPNIGKHIKQQAPNNLAPRLRIFPTKRHLRELYGPNLSIAILSLHRYRRKNNNIPVYILNDSASHHFMHFVTNQVSVTENKKDFIVGGA